MRVRKAVILAAGLGTRMLPASRVIPKEMLPVVDKPAIQLIVEEVVDSGITDIAIVVSPGRTTVLDHFRPAPELERHLEERGKRELLETVRATARLARITPIEQTRPLGLGHAVYQARNFAGGEPVAVLLPDDIVDGPRPLLRQILDVAERRDAPAVALLKVPAGEISKYGIVKASPVEPRLHRLTGMIEKPDPAKAPSDLAIIGRYVLTPEIFELLADARPGAGGEIQLTDALLRLSERRELYGYEFEGVRHDLGDRLGFLTAQIAFGLKRPDLADRLRTYLRSVIASWDRRPRAGQ
jgi:UTP--glucose-1-phosphate uridylyltransferase